MNVQVQVHVIIHFALIIFKGTGEKKGTMGNIPDSDLKQAERDRIDEIERINKKCERRVVCSNPYQANVTCQHCRAHMCNACFEVIVDYRLIPPLDNDPDTKNGFSVYYDHGTVCGYCRARPGVKLFDK
jgi:hypothetical protein